MDITAIISELRNRLGPEPNCNTEFPTADDVTRWTNNHPEAGFELYNLIAAVLAVDYNRGVMSFRFCDQVVNQLYSALIESSQRSLVQPWPDLFWKVFNAFDSGEHYRSSDHSDDPVLEHTDPLIREIVAGLEVN